LQCEQGGRGGYSDANVLKLRLFEIYGMSARTRKVEPVRIFFGQGGQFYSILCVRLLWTAPNRSRANLNMPGC